MNCVLAGRLMETPPTSIYLLIRFGGMVSALAPIAILVIPHMRATHSSHATNL